MRELLTFGEVLLNVNFIYYLSVREMCNIV